MSRVLHLVNLREIQDIHKVFELFDNYMDQVVFVTKQSFNAWL